MRSDEKVADSSHDDPENLDGRQREHG
jgi:hypothetical protein